jgi:hypothetical protein
MRLRERTRVAADGMQLLDTAGTGRGQIWFDTQLDAPCIFEGANDKALVCVPVSAFGDPEDTTNVSDAIKLAFVDAGCQGERVVAGPNGEQGPASAVHREAACGETRYATLVHEGAPVGASFDEDGSGNDDTGTDLYELGEPVGATPIFVRPPGADASACAPPAADAPNHFYRLGRRIGPGELVAGHVETVATGHRMAYQSIVADDGARQRIGWYDTALDTACSIGLARDGQHRCLPPATSVSFLPGLFADAGCHTPLVIWSSGDPAIFLTDTDGEGGLEPGAYYHIGEPPKQVFTDDGSACVAIDVGAPTLFRTLSDEVPPPAFDAFAETTVSTGRLDMTVHTDGDGATDPFPTTLTDPTTHEPCDFEPAADGKTRCLPWAGGVLYTSPSCASAPGAGGVTTSLVAGPPPTHAGAWSGDVCTGGFALSSVGQPVGSPGGDLWVTNPYGDFCVANPSLRDDTSLRFFAVGPPAPPASFEEATLSTHYTSF